MPSVRTLACRYTHTVRGCKYFRSHSSKVYCIQVKTCVTWSTTIGFGGLFATIPSTCNWGCWRGALTCCCDITFIQILLWYWPWQLQYLTEERHSRLRFPFFKLWKQYPLFLRICFWTSTSETTLHELDGCYCWQKQQVTNWFIPHIKVAAVPWCWSVGFFDGAVGLGSLVWIHSQAFISYPISLIKLVKFHSVSHSFLLIISCVVQTATCPATLKKVDFHRY